MSITSQELAEQQRKRKTAQQRREEEAARKEAQRQLDEIEARKLWPARLMCNLERATKLAMDIEVVNLQFEVSGYTRWNDRITFSFTLNPAHQYDQYYTEGDWEAMEALERHLNDLEETKREEERKRVAKETALAKLTPADREALGI